MSSGSKNLLNQTLRSVFLTGTLLFVVAPSWAQSLSIEKSMSPDVASLGDTLSVCLKISSPPGDPQADIVWVFDVTGSMSGGIEQLKTNIRTFATALAASGIDYRNALVTYRDIPDIVNYGFAAGDTEFLIWVNSLMATGGGDTAESGLEGLMSADTVAWRDGATRTMILITDAPVHSMEGGDGSLSITVTANTLKAEGVIIHTICNDETTYYPRQNPRDLSTLTGGLWMTYTSTATDWTAFMSTLGGEIAKYTNVRIRDPLPPELEPVSGTYGDATLVGNELIWTLSELERGMALTYCFLAVVKTPIPGSITNNGYVSSEEVPERGSNNESVWAPGVPTFTPTDTRTPTMTRTPTITRSPTPTFTATFTPSISVTRTPTGTFTKTPTMTGTIPPTPTNTPTPGDEFGVSKNLFKPKKDKELIIRCRVSIPGKFSLRIYNSAGEQVRVLRNVEQTSPLREDIRWNGKNSDGNPVASGIYVIYVESKIAKWIGKLMVVQ